MFYREHFTVILNVVMLTVVMLSIITLIVIMLGLTRLNVITLNVMGVFVGKYRSLPSKYGTYRCSTSVGFFFITLH